MKTAIQLHTQPAGESEPVCRWCFGRTMAGRSWCPLETNGWPHWYLVAFIHWTWAVTGEGW